MCHDSRMKKGKILSAAKLEKQAKEMQVAAAHIREKAAEERKKFTTQTNKPRHSTNTI
jgi:hypothetical protein